MTNAFLNFSVQQVDSSFVRLSDKRQNTGWQRLLLRLHKQAETVSNSPIQIAPTTF